MPAYFFEKNIEKIYRNFRKPLDKMLFLWYNIYIKGKHEASKEVQKEKNKMKSTTKIARQEIKKLIDTIGLNNILCKHITEIIDRTGVSVIDCQNAMNYYRYHK